MKKETQPSQPVDINGKHTPGEWKFNTNKRTRSTETDLTTDIDPLPFITIIHNESKYSEAEANAARIVLAVNNFNELVYIAQRAAITFGNESNYPSGTIGHTLGQRAKELLSKLNK